MSTLGLISVLVTVAALFGWLSARVLRVPQTIGSMGLTMTCSLALIGLAGLLPGLHTVAVTAVGKIDLRDLILNGMLGLLLFAGAFLLDLRMLKRERIAVGMLSVFATLISTAGVAAIMFYILPVIGIHGGWVECLLFGALISPTDPIAVLEMLGRVGVGPEIEAQLAGESLFNDGVGAVLFISVLGIAEGRTPTIAYVAERLVFQAGGALLLGVALAWITSQLMSRVDRYQVEILLSLSLACGGYALAQALNLSAPLEAVAAGLAMRQFNASHTHREISHADLDKFWTMADEVQNAVLFVLLGLEVLAISFNGGRLVAGACAIVAVSLVRLISVVVTLSGVRLLRPRLKTSVLALTWGGLRGGLSIALALSVPVTSGRQWMVAATYVVVVFSVLIQGGTLNMVLKHRWPHPAKPIQVTE